MSTLIVSQLIGGVIAGPCHTFLPVYLSDLGLSAILIAAIFTTQRIMGLVSSLVGGAMSDFFSSKQTLLLGQIGLVCAALVFASPSVIPVVILWAVYGFGTGLHTMGGQSYLIANADHKHLGTLTALYYWGSTVGGAVGGPIAALLLGDFYYVRFSITLAVAALIGLAIIASFLPSPRPTQSDTGDGDDRGDSGATREADKQTRNNTRFFGYGEIMRLPTARILAGLRFLPTFCYGMMTIFVPLVLRRNGAAAAVLAAYVTVSSVCAALSQFVVGRIADRVSPKWPTIVCYALLASSAICVGLFSTTIGGAFAFGVLGMSAAWSLSVLMAPLVALAAEAKERGRTLGFMHMFWNVGMILGSIVGGALFEVWFGLPFIVGGVVVAVCPALVVMFFRYARGVVEKEEL